MTARTNRWLAATVCGVTALAACSDALEQDTTAGQVVAVAEAMNMNASLVSAADLTVSHTIPLPLLVAGVGSLAGRGSVLILAGYGIVVMDLAVNTDAVTKVVPVEPGAAGQAAAIQSDSVTWAAYEMPFPGVPTRWRVWRANYRTNDTTSIGFTANPRALALGANGVFVVTVAADDASWLTVLDTTLATGPQRITMLDSIPLTGVGARGIARGADGFMDVTSSRHLTGGGSTEGRLAIVDPVSRHELAVINGLGDRLGPPVYHASGRILIPSANGILEVNAATRSVTLGPGKGIKPAGAAPNLLAVDQAGHVYAVVAPCGDPGSGAVHVLSPPPEYKLLTTIPMGVCAVGAATATVP